MDFASNNELLHFSQIDSQISHQPVECLVIICHGYGAPGNDLVPIAEEIMGRNEQDESWPHVRFVMPCAPLILEEIPFYEARAWWPLNMRMLEEAVGSGNIDALCRAEPAGLVNAREMLLKLIQQLLDELKLPLAKLILGGFSQGAMLATDVALSLPEQIGALVVFSGTLICEERWSEQAKRKPGLRVFQTHGLLDPILPVAAAKRLAKLFESAGIDVQFGTFPGPHTIPSQGMEMLEIAIKQVARG